jgi:hypothetical protein
LATNTTTVPVSSYQMIRTGTNGYAQIYFQQPLLASATNTVSVAAGTATNVTFSATTPADTGAPAAPTAVAAVAGPGNGEIDLSWVNHADNATSIVVQKSTDGTTWTTVATLTDITNTFYAITSGLTAGVPYYFSVYAANGTGNSSSATSSTTTSGTGIASRYGVTDLGTNVTPLYLNNSGSVVLSKSSSPYIYWANGTSTSMPTGFIPNALNTNNIVSGIQSGSATTWNTSAGATTLSALSLTTPLTFTANNNSISYSFVLTNSVAVTPALIDDSGKTYWKENGNYKVIKTSTGIAQGPGGGTVYGNSAGNILDCLVQGHDPINNQYAYNTGGTTLTPFEVNGTGILIGNYNQMQFQNWLTFSGSIASGSMWYNGTLHTLASNITPLAINSAGEILDRDSSTSAFSTLNSTYTIPSSGYATWSSANNIFWNSSHQILGNGQLWEPAVGSASATICKLSDLLSSSDWSSINTAGAGGTGTSLTKNLNDSGAIVSTATYSGTDPAYATGSHGVMLIPAELAVDADRNGTIVLANENPSGEDNSGNPVDQTTQTKPFRFWVNNDQDTPGTGDAPENLAVPTSDCNANFIVSNRDLEDWTRLWIYTKGLNTAIQAGTIKVGLKWKNTTGTPGIKIAPAKDSDGGLEYLTDTTRATAQVIQVQYDNNGYTTNIIPTGGAADFVFPASVWANLTDTAPKTYFIFEGTSVGKGQLEIVFLKSDGVTKIGEGGNLWLDLRDIKEMYEREISMPQPDKPYNYSSTPPTVNIVPFKDTSNPNGNSGTFVPDSNESSTHSYIVFVHGYNMPYLGSTNYAETMFKRLWWRGYKGRFAAFRWNTYGNGTAPLSPWWNLSLFLPGGAVGTYNDSEFVAWHSGTALKQFVQSLPSSYAVDIVSHSMGSIVVGEALAEGMTATHYSILHGAASASCYSTSGYTFPTTNTLRSSPDTDSDSATAALAYKKSFASIGGSPVNFYDDQDTVVGWKWGANNAVFKPQPITSLNHFFVNDYYYYTSSGSAGQKLGLEADTTVFFNHRALTDFAESRAYADYSLTGTIGATDTALTGSTGSISSSVNDNYFGDEHSSEFNRSIQQLEPFYNALMTSFILTPNP